MLFMGMLLSSSLIAQIVPKVDDGDPGNWPAALNDALNTKKTFARDINEFNFGDSHKDDGYTQGTSNNQRVEEWRWVFGNTNDKGDIENAGSILIGKKLYFFGDRSAFNGTAELGFWFLLDKVGPTGTGATPGSPFSGTHKHGDLLILNTFTSGGRAATPKIFMWKIDADHPAPGSLVGPLSADAASITNENTTYPAPGGTNGVVINIPARGAAAGTTQTWRFTSKKVGNTNTNDGTYYPPLFFEGYVDLATIPDANTCFQSFIMKTTTSANNTAANVDLVAGEFSGIPLPPTVTPDEACVDKQPVELYASCSHTSGTPTWYTTATGGTALGTADGVSADGGKLTKSGLPVGVTTYYVSCKDGECESARTPVTATIFPLPVVDGVVTEGENDNSIDDGITKVSDDVYSMRISLVKVANLKATATGGTGAYTYVWTALDANAAVSFVPNGADAVFTVLTTDQLNADYNFKVTVTDGKTCVAEDFVQIRPRGSCPPCGIIGSIVACQGGSVTYTYGNPIETPTDDGNPNTGTPFTFPIQDFDLIWTLPDGTTVTNVSSVTVTHSTIGTKTVSIAFKSRSGLLDNCPTCSLSTDVRQVTLNLDKRDLTCYQSGNGRITATFANGFPPYSISLNGVTTANVTSQHVFNNLAAGAYTVIITDAQNCADTKQITLTEPPLLTCSLTTPSALTCGSSGTVSGTISGGTSGYSCSAAFDATAAAGGWIVTNCSVTGTGITVSYTSGASVKSAVLTVTVTDVNGCTSTCSTPVECTGAHGCTPGFWQGGSGKPLWDEATDPVAIAAGFTTNTSFYAVFPGITAGTCSLPGTLKMIDAINTGGGNCNKLVRHGCAAILNAATLPDYPLPAGIANIAALKTAITNAINSCNCEPLATQIAANNDLNHDLCGQVLTSVANSFVSGRTIREEVSDDLEMHAYPNPYNNVVNFRFASPKTGKAVLEVYDIVGRRLAVVYQGNVSAKTPVSVKYNVPSLSRVALFYKLTVDNQSVRGSILPDKQ
jgi:hypothetical protein